TAVRSSTLQLTVSGGLTYPLLLAHLGIQLETIGLLHWIHNLASKMKLGKLTLLLLDRGKHIKKTMNSSCNILKEVMEEFGLTRQYLRGQWNRQRQCQLSLMNNGLVKELEEQEEELVELEDQLCESQNGPLRSRRRRNQTTAEVRQLEELPNTLIFLEEEIKSIVQDLGDDAEMIHFDASGDFPLSNSAADTRSLIKISKSKLYEAKVGVCEVQKKWDEQGSGELTPKSASMEFQIPDCDENYNFSWARFKKLMNLKMKLLKRKWNSYNRKAHEYNESFACNN
ncbi:hypothetical protein MJO29_016757, partial [Puccinia striiformis f. sp. tritici]